ncbi:COG4280 domain-containing protein [Streptomyces sp. NPDC087420]|uniref:COG4280 domain-containing protein n=1 Tax=Streptomyces sp. NPDC087420 TaxID=3365785 RepID=UPI003833C418
MNSLVLVLTVFVACAVEAVEALTVVLAAGTSRHWGSALQGTAAALVTLAVTVGVLGPAIGLIPLGALRLVVGALLLVFGLQWLHKAVLRASGLKPLRDEAAAYEKKSAAARTAGTGGRAAVRDWYAFTLSFKGVLLEGLEVAFIVVTFGNNQRNVPLAALGAAAAVLAVAGVGFAVRAPLARVPENTMKFVVGTMLASFGVFWSAEGAGVAWPGADVALLVLVPVVALVALGFTALLRRTAGHGPTPRAVTPPRRATASGEQHRAANRYLRRARSFAHFWYDFVVGDDWRVAAGTVAALAATYGLVRAGQNAWWLPPLAVLALLGLSLRGTRVRTAR